VKSFHLFAITVALASVTAPSTPAFANPASPPGQNGANAELLSFCEQLITSGDFTDALNFGRCMAFNDTSFEGLATQTCQALRGEGELAENGFDSFEDCVTTLQKRF
jgi:hypothetical protein